MAVVFVVQMTVVQIVGVVAVFDGGVAAACAVDMGVGGVGWGGGPMSSPPLRSPRRDCQLRMPLSVDSLSASSPCWMPIAGLGRKVASQMKS